MNAQEYKQIIDNTLFLITDPREIIDEVELEKAESRIHDSFLRQGKTEQQFQDYLTKAYEFRGNIVEAQLDSLTELLCSGYCEHDLPICECHHCYMTLRLNKIARKRYLQKPKIKMDSVGVRIEEAKRIINNSLDEKLDTTDLEEHDDLEELAEETKRNISALLQSNCDNRCVEFIFDILIKTVDLASVLDKRVFKLKSRKVLKKEAIKIIEISLYRKPFDKELYDFALETIENIKLLLRSNCEFQNAEFIISILVQNVDLFYRLKRE